jgi:uncharacterized protein
MQSEERDLIEGLFGRLKAYETQPRDPEADRLIGSLVAGQPGTPYLLIQTVLVQEHALKAAQARIAELEAKAAATPPPSFLGSAPKIGPWGAAPSAAPASAPGASPAAPPPTAPPPTAPWQASAPQQQAGGGFLRSALTTAAGVAGGALLFDGIRSMFGHSSPFGAGSFGAAPFGQTTIIEENNPTPLTPPDQWSQGDASQGDGVDTGDNSDSASTSDDYDTSSDDSSFGNSDSDDIV